MAGIPEALIRRDTWDDAFASSAFWMTLLSGLVFVLLFAGIVAPLSRSLAGNDFSNVLSALSVIFLIDAAGSVQESKLRREFRFRAIAVRNVAASLLTGLVGITLALLGFGVWALVLSRIAGSTLNTILTWQAAQWRPRAHMARTDVKNLVSFGVWLVLAQLLGQIGGRSADAVVGIFLGPAALAFYRVGWRVIDIIIQVAIHPLQTTALSAFSRLGDPGRMPDAYCRLTRMCSILACPIFFGTSAVATDLVRVVFGERWDISGQILTVLPLMAGPAVLNYFTGPALTSAGRTRLVLIFIGVASVGNLIAALSGAAFGLLFVAVALVVRDHLTLPLFLWLLKQGIGLEPMRAVRAVLPSYLAAAAMAALVFAVKSLMDPGLARLGVSVAVGAVSYPLILRVFAPAFLRGSVSEISSLLPPRIGFLLHKLSGTSTST
jgi:O-antigen/teichoic acid export membrane protein